MKQFVILVGALVISASCFADLTSKHDLSAISSAWKTQQSLHPKQVKNEITMVYGGADVSQRPTLVEKITTA